ncbi:MAG: conserved repeat domain protein [Herbaspirillum sp.]|nr:conserved repeat domain protein [Herbaspirillum sp.]
MFASHKILSGLFGLLFILLMLSAFNARAALPDAGTLIGTAATVTFTVGDVQEKSISNVVSTKIAQVYATDIKSLSGTVFAKADTTADMLFAVKNIGNGPDDVTLTAKFPNGIDSVEMFVADSSGVPDVDTRAEIKAGKAFPLKGIPRDQIKNILVRMKVPKGAAENTDYKFELKAENKGKNKPQTAEGLVQVVAEIPFTVDAGTKVSLNADKEALVAFNVRGRTAVKAYFEVILAKKSDLSRTALDYKLLKNQISFDRSDLDQSAINVTDNKIMFTVDATPEQHDTNFKMNIKIPTAEPGDEFVMFVKYGKADANNTIAPEGKLATSTELQITNVHAMAKPTLLVINNSIENKENIAGSDALATIAAAFSGDTVSYTLTLKNESTAPENFSLALDYISNQSIRNMTVLDEQGNKFNAASGAGWPETGLIGAGKTIIFKVQVDLAHATIKDAKPEMKLTVRSMTESKTAAVTQNFKISTVNAIANPIVNFFSDEKLTPIENNKLKIGGLDTAAVFYMQVQAPSVSNNANSRDYEIRFDTANTTFQMVDGDQLGAPSSAMPVTFTNGQAKVFLVKVDMRGKDTLDETATAVDVLGKGKGTASITLIKEQAVRFVKPAYAGNGSPDLDTLLTVDVVNPGSEIFKGDYAIALASVDGWEIAFRQNNDAWKETFALPPMKTGDAQPIQVKITVPKNASAGTIKSLNLVLRKKNGTDIESTVLTVTIGKSKLLVSKKVVVVDAADSATPASSAFAENGQREIKHGDGIWYQVVVTNPIDAPVAKEVTVTDPIPPYSAFVSNSASANPATGTASDYSKGNVVLKVDQIQPGDSVTLQYQVKVELEK